MNIVVSDELRAIAPQYVGAAIEADVTNAPTQPELWAEITRLTQELRASFDTTSIKERAGVKATRAAYKAAGKDPSRYRPSCEQLCRRVLQGKELYTIDALVDLGNAVSMMCGYTVAVLDRDKIQGDTLTLGIGREGEPYEAIGRGSLNIACMPVFRDAEGGIATPTSDNVRTQCDMGTKRVLVIINGYDGRRESLDDAAAYAADMLSRYAMAKNLATSVFA